MTVRAKFKVETLTVSEQSTTVAMSAVISGEGNESWSKWTPDGQMQMQITNPDAANYFKPGKEYFLDFSEA